MIELLLMGALVLATADTTLTTTPAAPPTVTGALTLDQALALARQFHPAAAESAAIARAAGLRARDEAHWLNPSLDFLHENFGGDLRRSAETTLSAAQPFEIGGARRARIQLAEAEERLAAAGLASREREIALGTGGAFLDTWWLERRLALLRRLEDVASATITAAEERAHAGAGPAVEGLRARTVLSERRIERRAVEAELIAARQQLALQWGAQATTFDTLMLAEPTLPPEPGPGTWSAALAQHPERLSAQAERDAAAARLREAKAMRIPDLTVSGGVRHFQETGGNGFLAGLSLPLPLWNRHGQLVRAAEAEQQAADLHVNRVQARLQLALVAATERLKAAVERHEEARTQLVPAAFEALRQLQRGYRAGRFTYLDQLEGQRAAADAEQTLIETARDAWSARLELDALVGPNPEGNK
jgi:cobalt-zinc-cadmium efflux system outer membrane protein